VDFNRESLPWRGKFLGGKFSTGNVTLGRLDTITIRISF